MSEKLLERLLKDWDDNCDHYDGDHLGGAEVLHEAGEFVEQEAPDTPDPKPSSNNIQFPDIDFNPFHWFPPIPIFSPFKDPAHP